MLVCVWPNRYQSVKILMTVKSGTVITRLARTHDGDFGMQAMLTL